MRRKPNHVKIVTSLPPGECYSTVIGGTYMAITNTRNQTVKLLQLLLKQALKMTMPKFISLDNMKNVVTEICMKATLRNKIKILKKP